MRGVSLGDAVVGATDELIQEVMVKGGPGEKIMARVPRCPDHADERMTLKRSRGRANSLFWGCSLYPLCEAVRFFGIERV